MATDLSKAEKLLVAAASLAAEGRDQFGAEDLIVQAFKKYPGDFSLKGYPEYPNSNAVLILVMGKKAVLITRGWLEKTGTKKYRLTPKGIHDFGELEGAAGSGVYVGRRMEEALGPLLFSPVYEIFQEGRGEEITFHQFCRFADLSAGDKWQKVAGTLEQMEHLVHEAVRQGEAGVTLNLHFRKRNRSFSPDDLRMLGALLTFVTARFRREMEEWKRNAFD